METKYLRQGHGKKLKYQEAIIFNEWHIIEISCIKFTDLIDYYLHIHKTSYQAWVLRRGMYPIQKLSNISPLHPPTPCFPHPPAPPSPPQKKEKVFLFLRKKM